jgi:hypothetical protein
MYTYPYIHRSQPFDASESAAEESRATDRRERKIDEFALGLHMY